MTKNTPIPSPIFDTLKALVHGIGSLPDYVVQDDAAISREFLLTYRGSPDTFRSYRREVKRFLQWDFLIARSHLKLIGRDEIEQYAVFARNRLTTGPRPK